MSTSFVRITCASVCALAAALTAFAAGQADLPANTWTNLERATVLRHDAPLIWEPHVKRFP
jgi:hypothetical protein